VKHSNRNFVLAYLLLVAMPLVGLAGVLRAGRHLTAPVAIGGTWRFHLPEEAASALACGKSLPQDATFTISQSGRQFTISSVSSTRTLASGTVQGEKVQINSLPLSSLTAYEACDSSSHVALRAAVDPQASPRSLVGTLVAIDCPNCPPVPFRAVRQDSGPKGAH
jgi:hypothetical protein